jgi:hypothetical protein
MPVVKGDQ